MIEMEILIEMLNEYIPINGEKIPKYLLQFNSYLFSTGIYVYLDQCLYLYLSLWSLMSNL